MLIFFLIQPCKRLEEELADALDELVTSEILRVQEVCINMNIIQTKT